MATVAILYIKDADEIFVLNDYKGRGGFLFGEEGKALGYRRGGLYATGRK